MAGYGVNITFYTPHIPQVMQALLQGKGDQGLDRITPHLLSSLRMGGAIPSFSHMPSWDAQGNFIFLYPLMKLKPLVAGCTRRTNSVGSVFELNLQTGHLDCVTRK